MPAATATEPRLRVGRRVARVGAFRAEAIPVGGAAAAMAAARQCHGRPEATDTGSFSSKFKVGATKARKATKHEKDVSCFLALSCFRVKTPLGAPKAHARSEALKLET